MGRALTATNSSSHFCLKCFYIQCDYMHLSNWCTVGFVILKVLISPDSPPPTHTHTVYCGCAFLFHYSLQHLKIIDWQRLTEKSVFWPMHFWSTSIINAFHSMCLLQNKTHLKFEVFSCIGDDLSGACSGLLIILLLYTAS